MKEKIKIQEEFSWLEENMLMAFVPVKNFNIDSIFRVGQKFTLYPAGILDEKSILGSCFDMEFQKKKDVFFDSTIIAFPIIYSRSLKYWALMPSTKDDLIRRVTNEAEEYLNIFRYIYSNIDKVSNLPQRAGYVEGNESGFLLYSSIMKGARYISGKNYVVNQTIGNPLEIDTSSMEPLIRTICNAVCNHNTTISNVIKHALRLYSDILYLPSATNRFVQAMTLIEYLGDPFEYQKMQKIKSKIVPFSAKNRCEYNKICERFKDLTSKEDEAHIQIGLRTNIIHNGKSIESLLEDGYKIDMVLREVQMYACNYINAILPYCDKNDWSVIEELIETTRNNVCKDKKDHIDRNECDSVIVIDYEFLNTAIEEVYQLYPSYREVPFSFIVFFELLLQQCDIHRLNYQIPCKIISKQDFEIYKENKITKISKLDGLEVSCDDGKIEIHTFCEKSNYHNALENILKNCALEKNYFFNDDSKYTNIVLISDYNNISNEIFTKINNSCKSIILGRLDNERTRTDAKCRYFDITYLIMQVIGIPLEEETEGKFIFEVPK